MEQISDVLRESIQNNFSFHGCRGNDLILTVRDLIELLQKHTSELSIRSLFQFEKEKMYAISKTKHGEIIVSYLKCYSCDEKLINAIYYLLSDISWYYQNTI